MELKKIESEEALVLNEFILIKNIRMFKSKNKKSNAMLDKAENIAFSIILASGYPVLVADGQFVFSGDKVGINENFMTDEKSIAQYCDSEYLDRVKSGNVNFSFMTENEKIQRELKAEIAKREEADKKAQEEKDRLLREKEEADRIAKQEAAKLEKEKEEAQKLEAKAYYESRHDALTGILNRKAFDEDTQNGVSGYIISIDANNLKLVNDTLGHLKGDELIKTIAQILDESFEQKAYRTGGDEFMVLCDKNPNNILTQIDTKFEEMSKDNDFIFEIAYGYARISSEDNLKEKIDEADKYMYENKEKKKSARISGIKAASQTEIKPALSEENSNESKILAKSWQTIENTVTEKQSDKKESSDAGTAFEDKAATEQSKVPFDREETANETVSEPKPADTDTEASNKNDDDTKEEVKTLPLPFGYEPEPADKKETEENKYFSTFWFNKHHVVCQNKNTILGLNAKEFDITVYPLAKPDKEYASLPVQIMICISNEIEKRNVVVFPEKGMRSLIAAYDDYIFNISGRFTPEGFKAKISLDMGSEYDIASDDDTVIMQKGDYIPDSFCKTVRWDEDTVELYPLYTDNKEDNGMVTCVYRHFSPIAEPEVGVIPGEILLTSSKNENFQIYTFWFGDGDERVLKTNMS